MLKRSYRFFLLMVIALLTVAGCSSGGSQGAGGKTQENATPKGSIEFISSYAPGGGHDNMLRTMSKIATEEKIIDNTITVVNKPGGSGAVGMAYTSEKKGKSNYIMAVTSSFLTTPLQGGMNLSYKDFTPIARLGLDPYVLVVKANSGINSFDDFVNKGKGKSLTFGGTAVGSGEHMLAIQISEAANIKTEYVPFEGDGQVTTALLGGHIDVTANNLNATLEYIENGDMVPIAVSTTERLTKLPNVPTLKELGYDIEWVLFRGIYGPPDMPAENVKWYQEKLKTLSENPKWKQEYLDKYMVESGFLAGEEFKQYLDKMNAAYEENLKKLGIIK